MYFTRLSAGESYHAPWFNLCELKTIKKALWKRLCIPLNEVVSHISDGSVSEDEAIFLVWLRKKGTVPGSLDLTNVACELFLLFTMALVFLIEIQLTLVSGTQYSDLTTLYNTVLAMISLVITCHRITLLWYYWLCSLSCTFLSFFIILIQDS